MIHTEIKFIQQFFMQIPIPNFMITFGVHLNAKFNENSFNKIRNKPAEKDTIRKLCILCKECTQKKCKKLVSFINLDFKGKSCRNIFQSHSLPIFYKPVPQTEE
jgi:hypothetical protein